MKPILIVLATLLLSGCMETQDQYTLNPDGTGKVVHQVVFQPSPDALVNDVSGGSSKNIARKAVLKILQESVGVDAWRDVTYEHQDDSRIRLSATAYFRDIDKLRFYDNGLKLDILVPHWEGGELTVKIADRDQEARAIPQSEDQVQAAMEKAREQLRNGLFVFGLLGDMKMDLSFRLPGAVVDSSNLDRLDAHTLGLRFAGEKLVEALERRRESIADDKWLRERVEAGEDPFLSSHDSLNELNKLWFGEAKPVRAKVALDSSPLFDYAGDVAIAKEQMPSILQSLGAPASLEVHNTEVKDLVLGGERWTWLDEVEWHSFRTKGRGVALILVAGLPEPALEVTKVELTRATTDTGESLLPDERAIFNPWLSEDRSQVVFQVGLPFPRDAAQSVEELSGRITYVTGKEPTRKIDLGFPQIVEGAVGAQLGGVITQFLPNHPEQGLTTIKLQLNVSPFGVASAEMLDEHGDPQYIKIWGRSLINPTIDAEVKGEPPVDGKILLDVYDDLKLNQAVFALNDIKLTGRAGAASFGNEAPSEKATDRAGRGGATTPADDIFSDAWIEKREKALLAACPGALDVCAVHAARPNIRIVGEVEPSMVANIEAPVTGKIDKVSHKPGDTVHEGEILVVIRHGSQELQQLGVSSLLGEATSKLSVVIAEAGKGTEQDRGEQPLGRQLTDIREQLEEARSELVRQSAGKGQAPGADPAGEDAARSVRAPFAGTIISRAAGLGEQVVYGDHLLSLGDQTWRQVRIQVPARLVDYLRPGAIVPVRIELSGRIAPARVAQVYPLIDKESDTVTVLLDLPEGVAKSPLGQKATVEIPDWSAPEKPVLHAEAIYGNMEHVKVVVVTPAGQCEPREVTVREYGVDAESHGRQDRFMVDSGLERHERVLCYPARALLSDGE